MSTKSELVRMVVSMATGAVLFCAGAYAARAWENGPTKGSLSFAGTLTNGQDVPLPGQHMLSFVLKGPGGAEVCSPPASSVDVDKNGSFTAEIDASGCKGDPFNGQDLTVEVREGGVLAGAGPVNPVPYAKYADKVGSADCPVGYEKDPSPPNPFVAGSILCKKGDDEVVKVGTGASAFWIDRYEASIWTMAVGGAQEFSMQDDSSPDFPKNGQVLVSRFARSVAGVTPSRFLTWFQAVEACAASGKRLPGRQEWLRAARGTRDPAMDNDGTTNARCNTVSSVLGPRNTGVGVGAAVDASCVSDWGVQDMIGNLWEWTDEWYAGLADASGTYSGTSTWGDASLYHGDGTWNIAGKACQNVGCPTNLPAAGLRGGSWATGPLSGIFTLSLYTTPAYWDMYVGLRCVLPR
ncbi:MAG: SUMF1/EgtB/PvdO family nonheme iron enzyme [Byssovorax sp.]